jgi:dCMP deaminase
MGNGYKTKEENNMDAFDYLKLASDYASVASGCIKVQVGCVISKDGNVVALGANRTLPNTCKTLGCHRVRLYGDNSKEHRLPSDCLAIHSEVDAIAKAGTDLHGATIFVTRYPCEACARAIVASGIKKVVFGREQPISDMTAEIFTKNGVTVYWENNWIEEDTTK